MPIILGLFTVNWINLPSIVSLIFLSPLDAHRREIDDLREELRKLKEEKLDSKLKFLQIHRDNSDHLANGKLYSTFWCRILVIGGAFFPRPFFTKNLIWKNFIYVIETFTKWDLRLLESFFIFNSSTLGESTLHSSSSGFDHLPL